MHQVTDFLFSIIKEYLELSNVDEVLVRRIIMVFFISHDALFVCVIYSHRALAFK